MNTNRGGFWRTAGATAVICVFLPPLLLLVAGSLRQPGLAPPPTPELIPDPISGRGYAAALPALVRAAGNSLLVCVIAVPVSVLVSALAGFALARSSRGVVTAVAVLSLVALMIPATALLVPRFAIFSTLGLTNTLAPLVAPALIGTSPMYPLIYYVAFRRLPAHLWDVCALADLSPIQVWWRVAMPLTKHVTAAIAALTYILTWSNFLDPLIYTYDSRLATLPLALRSLATLDPADAPIFLAGAALATLPALAVFWVAQRQLPHLGEH